MPQTGIVVLDAERAVEIERRRAGRGGSGPRDDGDDDGDGDDAQCPNGRPRGAATAQLRTACA